MTARSSSVVAFAEHPPAIQSITWYDLVITDLADSNAALEDENATLRASERSWREFGCAALSMLARVTYERDTKTMRLREVFDVRRYDGERNEVEPS